MASSNGSIKAMFQSVASKKKSPAENVPSRMDIGDVPDIDNVLAAKPSAKGRVSIERIYQKKTQHEHVLLRPDTYIGSVEKMTQPMWVFDQTNETMVQRNITFVPGLYKIFDEILVNAADNKQRDPKGMNTIKIDIDPENNVIKIWNNGKGIPVVMHKDEKMFVPTMIFGHLLTSSNYDDTEKKVTGGRNGYGAKLCNIFSNKFVVETSSKDFSKTFRQVWTENMTKTIEPIIGTPKGEDFTCITFSPDLNKFMMDTLDKDIVDLFTRRAYDIVASTRGVKVILNGKRLEIKNFKDYVDLYTKDKVDELNQPLKLVHEIATDRWEVAVTMSEGTFQQVSFVNSIATTKGGRHVDYVTEMIVSHLVEVLKKKEKKGGYSIKPHQVKSHVWVFVNALIENPTFDSQTKENMTLQPKSFGSKCAFSDKFMTNVSKCGIVEAIQSFMQVKQQAQLNQKCSGQKRSKLKGIPKLDDANEAGTKHSTECTLILTEGDSAKALVVAGLGVVGRDRYGVFPLRGKLLNVREATHKQIMENSEINNMIKIIGLQYKNKYDSRESLQTLRYGRLMIMTDQDQDGSHIKGLLINFIHHNWPNLLKFNFVEEFITPIVKVTKNNQEKSFYSLPEFEEWKAATDKWNSWTVKYYKGLGTSTGKEAKEYFHDMTRHRIPFKYTGPEDDAAIVLAFSKKKIEERKEWLTNWMDDRKHRAQIGLADVYLYGKDTKLVTYNEFVNRELILYSNMDNERSIPSLVDGFKPGQRKVIFTCFKRNLIKELKVAQLAGSVAEMSAYHHGEASLMATIINLAQNFVGSNNLNLLLPIGQFGTRLNGGKDSASPRYIFTKLSPLTRHMFNLNDDALLKYLRDDNKVIEPEWYIPILPLVLINGADGIGTGWSTKIPNFDIRQLASNILLLIDGKDPEPMLPSFKNFKGTVEALDDTRYVTNGEVSVIDNQTIEITELPVRVWTQTYKENVLEPMLQGTDKVPATILDYKEYHTDTTVKFVVKMSPENLRNAEQTGLHNFFKLQTSISTSSMVLFDAYGVIKRYTNVEEILREFYTIRLEYYQKRKDYLMGMLTAESLKLHNQARFICEKIDGKITIENKPKKDLIQLLVDRGYDSDPVKAWLATQKGLLQNKKSEEENEDESNEADGKSEDTKGPDFNYILNMALWCLSKERKEELLKQRDAKAAELVELKKKLPTGLWKTDLEVFLAELDKVEQKEREDEQAGITQAKGKAKSKKVTPALETRPSPMGRRVLPSLDLLRARAEAAVKKQRKPKGDKKSGGGEEEEDILDAFDTETKSLADPVGSSDSAEKPAKAKRVRKPKEKKDTDSPKKRGSSQKKRGKKRNPWSDEDSDLSVDLSDVNLSDAELNASFSNSVESRDKGPRRAAAMKIKYSYSDDEDQEADKNFDDGNGYDEDEMKTTNHKLSDDIIIPSDDDVSGPSNQAQPVQMKKNLKVMESDEDDYMPSRSPTPEKKKAAPKKDKPSKPRQPRKPAADKPSKATKKLQPSNAAIFLPETVDGNDVADVILADSQPSLGPTKKKAAPKRKPMFLDEDDHSSEEFLPSKPTTKNTGGGRKKDTVPKIAAAKKRKSSGGSEASGDEGLIPKAKPAIKKKKIIADDYENEDQNDVVNIPLRARLGRSRAPVQYNFGESDEDDI